MRETNFSDPLLNYRQNIHSHDEFYEKMTQADHNYASRSQDTTNIARIHLMISSLLVLV